VAVVVLVSVPESEMRREAPGCGRVGLLEEAQVPLAHGMARVAQRGQILWQQDLRERQAPGLRLQDQFMLHTCLTERGFTSVTICTTCFSIEPTQRIHGFHVILIITSDYFYDLL
jgi:hypothetical protein